jgi:hypothetical protein
MTEAIAKIQLETPEFAGLEKSKADKIRQTFIPMADMLTAFEEAYNGVMAEKDAGGVTEVLTKKAKRLRLDIAKIRIETEKVRKSEKEEYLRAGKAIDGVANILKWAVRDKEEKLEAIENHFEEIKRQERDALQAARVAELAPYVADAAERTLCDMETDVWAAYLSTKRREHEDLLAAEAKAAEERRAKEAAEAAERERIRQENERLKHEAAELEAKAKAEREAAAELQRQADAKRREEQVARERAEAELRSIQAEKAKAEREAAEAEAARLEVERNMGDKEKVAAMLQDFAAIKEKYQFASAKNRKMHAAIFDAIREVVRNNR